ncbi:MAG: pre-peptidase C-terminal domain-containing protein [Granulosicoccaceae bacterium]
MKTKQPSVGRSIRPHNGRRLTHIALAVCCFAGLSNPGFAKEPTAESSLLTNKDIPRTAALTLGEGGRWSTPEDWPLIAVHAALMPDGKVLAWDATPDDFDGDPHTRGTSSTRATLWDPINNTHQPANSTTQYDLFCAGSAHLPNGSLLFSGGDSGAGGANGPDAGSSTFNPFNATWSRESNLVTRRWYASVAALPSGEMLTWGGSFIGNNAMGEVYGTDGVWRPLTARPTYSIGGDYQWLQTTPNGKVAHLGPSNSMGFIDTEANLFDGGKNRDAIWRGYGSYAVYTNGKALVAGGGSSTRDSVVVDLNTLSTQSTGDMNIGRRQHNLTILADGTVMASGGNNTGAGLVDMNGAVYDTESWDPATGQWSKLAPMAINRQYHSIALLLADGRVLSAGGGYCGTCTQVGYKEQNAEVYSPPYLFNADGTAADRPVIQQAPTSIGYGQPFQLTVSAAQVQKLHLIKLGSTTHSGNQDQRLVPLSYTSTGNGTITVTAEGPDNRNLAPPGHYMLIAVDNAGVPSVSRIIRVGNVESNLATGGTASQSSSYPGGNAEKAIDTNTNGLWSAGSVTHTNNQNQPWWQVDLGEVKAIETVELFNRSDCCSSRLNNVYVFISEEPISGSTVSQAQAQNNVQTVRFPGTVGAKTTLQVNGVGRYVRVQLGQQGILSLAEVKVLGSAPTNLALGSNATQSSNYTATADATRAVDGDTMGNHSQAPIAITRLQSQPWWQTDLGAVARLGEIVLHNRRDCCANRLSDFYVLSSEQEISGSLSNVLADPSVNAIYHPGSFSGVKSFSVDTNARYIRVQLNGSNYLQLTEVEAFAKHGASNEAPSISNPGAQQSTVNQAVSLTINASDSDGDTLRFSANNLPTGLSIDPISGIISGSASTVGTSSVTVSVSDSQAVSAVQFSWQITAETDNNTLTSGNQVSGSAALRSWTYYTIDSRATDDQLRVDLDGLSADVDLYVRAGARPSGHVDEGGTYDCGSYVGGDNPESCTLENTQATQWHIGVYGYRASNYTLEATLIDNAGGNLDTLLPLDQSTTGAVARSTWQHYKVNVPATTQEVTFVLSGMSADADMYVRRGQRPSGAVSEGGNYDCGSYVGGTTDESCVLTNTGANTYFVSVHGYRGTGYTLAVSGRDSSNTTVTALGSGSASSGSVAQGEWQYFSIDADVNSSRLTVTLDGLSNDGDLYVRSGSIPSGNPAAGANSDCISWLGSTTSESCELSNTSTTTWYIGVYGYAATDFRVTAVLHNDTRRAIDKPRVFGKGEDSKAAIEADKAAVVGGGGSTGALLLIALPLACRARRRRH